MGELILQNKQEQEDLKEIIRLYRTAGYNWHYISNRTGLSVNFLIDFRDNLMI